MAQAVPTTPIIATFMAYTNSPKRWKFRTLYRYIFLQITVHNLSSKSLTFYVLIALQSPRRCLRITSRRMNSWNAMIRQLQLTYATMWIRNNAIGIFWCSPWPTNSPSRYTGLLISHLSIFSKQDTYPDQRVWKIHQPMQLQCSLKQSSQTQMYTIINTWQMCVCIHIK